VGGLFFYAKNCRTNFSATAPYLFSRDLKKTCPKR